MSAERVERRLAAVLAADIAGYSLLMGRDEEGTLFLDFGHFAVNRDGKFHPSLAHTRALAIAISELSLFILTVSVSLSATITNAI